MQTMLLPARRRRGSTLPTLLALSSIPINFVRFALLGALVYGFYTVFPHLFQSIQPYIPLVTSVSFLGVAFIATTWLMIYLFEVSSSIYKTHSKLIQHTMIRCIDFFLIVKPKRSSKIIDRPELRSPLLRIAEMMASISVWTIFLYLIQSLFTVFLWFVNVRLLKTELFSPAAVDGSLKMFSGSLYFAIFIFVAISAWHQWNYWRFGRLNRRTERPKVRNSDMAVYYNLHLAAVHQAQTNKITVIMPTSNGVSISEEPLPLKHSVLTWHPTIYNHQDANICA